MHELWQKECKTEKESTPVHIFEARTQMPAHLFQGAAFMRHCNRDYRHWFILKLPLKILMAPVILSLTLFVWICVGIVYVSGLVLGLISMVVALLGVAVLITYSLQNGIILLVIAFLISPYGLPMAAIWLLGKVQDLKFIIQDLVYG